MGRTAGREDEPTSRDLMKHLPHVVVPPPWVDRELGLTSGQWRHLTRVLRLAPRGPVSYTDGEGTVGRGSLGDHALVRGDEHGVQRPSALVMAVAPPANRDRQRFVVEKLAELGIARLQWLGTRNGDERVAAPEKIRSWVVAAVEQSRGAWLMETSPDIVGFDDLQNPVAVCHPDGARAIPSVKTVAIGPEGGFSEDEVPDSSQLWDLGPTILRVETAALVAAAIINNR